jgi:oligopeptide transport system permease protein
MLDVVNQDYVLTAESKGLSRGQIIRHHILRNSFIPVMTQLPVTVAMCITGSFFIESIFSIPGIGQYYVTAVNNQDLSIVMGETVLLAILYIVVLFITDVLYAVVDPRIAMPGQEGK